MRKFPLFIGLSILCIAVGAAITWTNRENILAHFMSRQLHVPVSIKLLDISKTSAVINRLWVGTSFTSETVKLEAKWDQIFGNPVTIEEVDIDNIFVRLEFYDSKRVDSNWTRILQKEQPKKNQRDYLIKTLILRNLTVEVTEADGTAKRYPPINEMAFYNISSETGFPVDEIEKAIFDLMIKTLFQKLQLVK